MLSKVSRRTIQRLLPQGGSRKYSNQSQQNAAAHVQPEAEVLFNQVEGSGVVTLNRPKALNSLTLNMVQQMYKQYQEWENVSSVKNIVVVGSGEKAFCAGGDIRAIYDSVKDQTKSEANKPRSERTSSRFFYEEYQMNYLTQVCKKPQIAIMDVGGGVGISVHGKYRVATENTLFAMPETGIGFFPDVGGSHFLPRLPDAMGMFLALTGYRLQGAEIKDIGIATHFVNRTDIPELRTILSQTETDKIKQALEKFEQKANRAHPKATNVLENHGDFINKTFSLPSLSKIVDALERDGKEFSQELLATMKKCSPLAMLVTFEQIQRGNELDLANCLKMEYRMTQHFMEDPNFFEGVRALLVDKDKNPKWNPATLAEVSDETVAKFFTNVDFELSLLDRKSQ